MQCDKGADGIEMESSDCSTHAAIRQQTARHNRVEFEAHAVATWAAVNTSSACLGLEPTLVALAPIPYTCPPRPLPPALPHHPLLLSPTCGTCPQPACPPGG